MISTTFLQFSFVYIHRSHKMFSIEVKSKYFHCKFFNNNTENPGIACESSGIAMWNCMRMTTCKITFFFSCLKLTSWSKIFTDHVLFLFLNRSSSSYEVHHVCHGASSANLFTCRICNHNLCNHRIRISCWKISLCVQQKYVG